MTCNAESFILSLAGAHQGRDTLTKRAAPSAVHFVNVVIVLTRDFIEPFDYIG
jgi:hypothetical protein